MKDQRVPALTVAGLVALGGILLGLRATEGARAAEPTPAHLYSPTPTVPPPTKIALGSLSCTECHSNPAIKGTNPALYVQQSALTSSVHSSLECISCHGELGANLHSSMAAAKASAQASCARCHQPEQQAYASSAHAPGYKGPAPPEGAPRSSPTCVTCHGSHSIQPANRDFVVANARVCSACHIERGQSFFDSNYHGKETALGRYDVAVCADCHTAHTPLPSADPRSTISAQNVVATCAKCHTGAPPNFAGIIIHVGGGPLPSDPKLKAVTVYMLLVLVGTFGFFGTHTLLGIRHRFRERQAAPPEGGAGE